MKIFTDNYTPMQFSKLKIELGQIVDLRHSQVNLANNLFTVRSQMKRKHVHFLFEL